MLRKFMFGNSFSFSLKKVGAILIQEAQNFFQCKSCLFAEVSNRSHAGKAFAKFNAVNYNYNLSKFSATFRVTFGQLLPDHTVTDFAGTHLYTIHQDFYSTFLNQNGEIDIDRALKNKGKFVVCNPMVAIQRNGFSDNRKKVMNYSIYFQGRSLYH